MKLCVETIEKSRMNTTTVGTPQVYYNIIMSKAPRIDYKYYFIYNNNLANYKHWYLGYCDSDKTKEYY